MLSVLTFRTPAEAVEKANNTPVRPVGRRLDRQGLAHPLDGRPAARRRRVGQHVQPLRPDQPVRRLQGVRIRPRGRPARLGGLPCPLTDHREEADRQPDERRPPRRAQDLQALHRRRLPAQRVGPVVRRRATPRARSSPTRRRRPARTPATPSWRPARRSAAGRPARRTTAARSSTGSPRCSRVGATSSSTRCSAARASPSAQAAAAVDASIDRLVWYAGWADKIAQVVGGTNPVAGPYFDFSIPEPTGVVAVAGARRTRRCSASSAWSPRSSSPATPCVVTRRIERPAAGHHARRRCSPPPTCPAASSTCSPASSAEVGAVAGVAHGRQRDRPDRASATPSLRSSSRSRRPTTSSGSSRPGAETATGPPTRASRRMTALPRDQDRLAPDRRLTG